MYLDAAQKRKIYIAIGVFIGLIIVVSVIGFVQSRSRTLPSEITAFSNTTENAPLPEARRGVFGLEDLYTSTLSTYQSGRIATELQYFLDDNRSLKNLTIDKASVVFTPVPERSTTMVRFTALSDTNIQYAVTGEYRTANDIYVTVYDPAGAQVYAQDIND